jgi:hypothetical protein
MPLKPNNYIKNIFFSVSKICQVASKCYNSESDYIKQQSMTSRSAWDERGWRFSREEQQHPGEPDRRWPTLVVWAPAFEAAVSGRIGSTPRRMLVGTHRYNMEKC